MNKSLSITSVAAIITAERRVVCWGNNMHGQCDVPADLENVVAVCTGYEFAAALTAEGRVVTWGNAEFSVPADVSSTTVTDICSGTEHILVLTADGRVICWGIKSRGLKLCDIPDGIEPVIMITCGYYHNAILTAAGEIVCWNREKCVRRIYQNILTICSSNFYTAILFKNTGTDSYDNSSNCFIYWCGSSMSKNHVSKNVPANEIFTDVNFGQGYAAGLTMDGRVLCWGENDHGCLNASVDLRNVLFMHTCYWNTAVITAERRVVCCGDNCCGLCDVPADLENVVNVQLKPGYAVAITADGRVVTWGTTIAKDRKIPADLVAQTGMVVLM